MMLEVVSLEDAASAVLGRFGALSHGEETVGLSHAAGRVAARDIVAEQGVPPFDRSTVDGFALVASDTFGCSEALPALLDLIGEVDMGAEPDCACVPGACVRIPTGGEVPQGADAVVMLEHCEEYGDGTIGISRPAAPGSNIVFACDDVKPGQVLVPAGTALLPHHVGALASLGLATCAVRPRPRVGVVSTGDEIVPVEAAPVASQMRDVNAPVLAAAAEACGAEALRYPIVPDDFDALLAVVNDALASCDAVLVSGGSSAGRKDNTARVLASVGELMFHGVAVKPGKPTMCADCGGKPAFGLPGHPVAAYLMFLELARPLLVRDTGRRERGADATVCAVLAEGVPSNHGRAELVAVRLEAREGGTRAVPVRGKSGLISQLAQADGYLEVPRNCEGLAAGSEVQVKPF